jgi:hypothetical protein
MQEEKGYELWSNPSALADFLRLKKQFKVILDQGG